LCCKSGLYFLLIKYIPRHVSKKISNLQTNSEIFEKPSGQSLGLIVMSHLLGEV
jgi:hypothetical protein